jgi:HAD superfamily hydrolase (TIGR01509 family)
MDGVLVDSEPAFYDAVNLVLAEEGRSIEFERYKRLLGTSVEETWRGVMAMLTLRGDLQGYLERYDSVLIECLRAEKRPLPGVVELLDELQRRAVPYALASSSWQTWVDVVLGSAGLRERFRVFSTPDVVERQKPAPDTYLKAAELLSIAPERCIAVEDTPPGIAAAKAAGMFAVHVRASSTAFAPIDGADLVIESLDAFPLAMLG